MYINIYVFGDSIAWGCWDIKKGGWVDRLKVYFQAQKYSDKFRVYLYNLSVGGDTTNWLLDRFKNEIKERITQNNKERKFDIIIFAIGMNDSRTKNPRVSFNKFQKNIYKLIEQAKEFTPKVVFVGFNKVNKAKRFPVHWNGAKEYNNENIVKYNSAMKEICRKKKVHFVSILNLLEREDLEDGVHPNIEGHRKIFERVKNFLLENKLLEK